MLLLISQPAVTGLSFPSKENYNLKRKILQNGHLQILELELQTKRVFINQGNSNKQLTGQKSNLQLRATILKMRPMFYSHIFIYPKYLAYLDVPKSIGKCVHNWTKFPTAYYLFDRSDHHSVGISFWLKPLCIKMVKKCYIVGYPLTILEKVRLILWIQFILENCSRLLDSSIRQVGSQNLSTIAPSNPSIPNPCYKDSSLEGRNLIHVIIHLTKDPSAPLSSPSQ